MRRPPVSSHPFYAWSYHSLIKEYSPCSILDRSGRLISSSTWTNEAKSYLALRDSLPEGTAAGQRYAGGVKQNLIPFVAKVIAIGDSKKVMGDALFVRPEQHEYEARVTLMFPIKENPAPYDPKGANPDYNEEVLTVKLDAGAKPTDLFERGKSYQVNFTFYGYQKADVNVQLTGWINGGEINPDFLGDVED